MKQEMIDPKQDFMEALDELEKDRGINKEIIIVRKLFINFTFNNNFNKKQTNI